MLDLLRNQHPQEIQVIEAEIDSLLTRVETVLTSKEKDINQKLEAIDGIRLDLAIEDTQVKERLSNVQKQEDLLKRKREVIKI